MIRSAARILPAVATMMMAATAGRAATPPAPATAGWEESGEASWYGGFHHGRRTSSGAVFDMNGMTAAHESLPLGSKVRVTVQDTGASVIVTITDRQPHKNFRVIDLARGAASRLGMLHRGAWRPDCWRDSRGRQPDGAPPSGGASSAGRGSFAGKSAFGAGPAMLSRSVCDSSSAFSSAPSSTAYAVT
jgi:rare lipoprotein A